MNNVYFHVFGADHIKNTQWKDLVIDELVNLGADCVSSDDNELVFLAGKQVIINDVLNYLNQEQKAGRCWFKQLV